MLSSTIWKHFTKKSLHERLESQHELMTTKYWFISRSNETIKPTEDNRLEQLDKEIIGNQLKYLHKAIESLSNKKYVEDKFSFPIDNLKSKYQIF